jgi:hypothetical protein
MNPKPLIACALALLSAAPAGAHKLDEYLQATMIEVDRTHVRMELRLAPGVAVFPIVFAGIDGDVDGIASAAEQQDYAERVLRDLSLTLDGRPLPLRLASFVFAPKEPLQQGLGEIHLSIEADLPATAARRRLIFENHHERRIGTYLVNALVPRDPDIRLGAQQRSDDQAFYQLEYADASAPANALPPVSRPGLWAWMMSALLAFMCFLLGNRSWPRL